MQIEPAHFSDQVYAALKAAFSELLQANPDQSFYAFALFTDDSLQFLHAVANSEEGLTSTVKHYRKTVDPKYGTTSTRSGMRWSYGDWSFFPEVGAAHFGEINEALRANFDNDEETFNQVTESLWPAILKAFQRLEDEHFFDAGPARTKITLLPVGDLPSELIDHWVLTLNPPDVAHRFIHWDTEAMDDTSV
ncbi:uncharacterized protein DUF4303 [Prosthecobacter fusiformis]|uniref:Uncharacterized protein DUF4303 n=1 Tax=Prosthecobacter fusiformis TaxID=48464 RepID=A0A4V3FI95_9BACT|nr:DUF4303 domain-containing protein [Prosthecobacter fusiformis]TDU81583.1 uncharacterized protein DUF4303 [Prosthecobacter fusiformis]